MIKLIEKLKPCPFCGGESELITSEGGRNHPGVSSVKCKACDALGGEPRVNIWRCSHPSRSSEGVTIYDEEATILHDNEAISLWNRRTKN